MVQTRPQNIGRYRVDEVLGRGAMGIVYKAYDEAIDRFVALKTVRADLLTGPDGAEWLERFKREARAAARCLHQNIVTVFEYGEDAGVAYISMEYVRGRQLQEFLAHRARFGEDFCVRVVVQILQGLAVAHAHGIVHRDIKPSNVIILDNGIVKVTDFGIARVDSISISHHGMMVGTPSYMAPEQFTGGEIDRRTDLFGVGVVLYELLTGEKPFPGNSVTEVMYRVMNHPPRDPADYNVRLAPHLRAILMKALERDPAMRFQSAESFASALEQGIAAEGHPGGREDAATVIETVASSLPATPLPTQSVGRGDLDEAALRRAEDDLASFIGPVAKVIVRNSLGKVDSLGQLYDSLALHITQESERSAFLRKASRATLGLSSDTGGGRTGRGGTEAGGTGRNTGLLGRSRWLTGIVGRSEGGTSAGPGGTAVGGAATGRTGVGGGGTGIGGSADRSSGSGASFGDETGIPAAEIERARQALTVHVGPIAAVLVKKAAGKASNVAELYRLLAEQIPDPAERSKFLQTVGWM